VALGVVAGNCLGNVLHHQGLTGFGRCHDQAALAFADGRNQIDDARGQIFGGTVTGFQAQTLIGEQGGEVFKQDFVLGAFGLVKVDLVDLEEGEVALAFLRGSDLARNGVAGA